MNSWILDSNIIIGITKGIIRSSILLENDIFISDISKLEILGYYKIGRNEKDKLRNFIQHIAHLSISTEIIDHAIVLRQQKSMSVGDAIIAGTGIFHQLPLVTANIKDFKHIKELELIDPVNL